MLGVKFEFTKFSKQQADKAIKDKNLPLALSRLKKDGWLKIELDQEDSRKSVYTLRDPKEAITEAVQEAAKASSNTA